MKITPDHFATLETLLQERARAIGFPGLPEFIAAVRQKIAAGELRAPIKSEAVMILSYLNRGPVLEFTCGTLYKYLNDTHIRTAEERIFAKHALPITA